MNRTAPAPAPRDDLSDRQRERACIIAEATCPRSHGEKVCDACWARGEERVRGEGEQLGLYQMAIAGGG